MQNLKLVYTFADRFPSFGEYLFLLVLAAIGPCVFYYNLKFVDKDELTSYYANKRKNGMILGAFIFIFLGSISALISYMDVKEYFKTKRVFNSKSYKIVEGRVCNYHPMTISGHDTERFDVNGIYFFYSDTNHSDYGYNNAAINGGAIKDSLYVQISYFDNGTKNVILKLKTE